MSYDVIWSPEAELSYVNILQYLNEHWSYSELEAFDNIVNEAVDRISKSPMMYQYLKEKDIHRCVLAKQVSLFYRVKKSSKWLN